MSEEVQAAEVAPEVVEPAETPEQEVSDVGNAPEVAEAIAADPEAAEAIAEAVESGEITEEQAVEMIKQLTIKVDGKEIVRDLPFEVDPNNKEMLEYLQKEAQLAEVAQKRMQEAAEAKKNSKHLESEMEQFLSSLRDKQHLEKVLAELGHDPAQLAEDILTREMEKMQLSPEQRELEELRQKFEQIEAEKVAAEEARQQAEMERMKNEYAVNFEKDLMGAMDVGGLPNDPYIINEMANMMQVAIQSGLDVSFSDLVPLVQEKESSRVRNALSGLSADQLLEILAEKQVNDLILKKTPAEKKEAPPVAESIKESGEPKKKQNAVKKRTESADDYFRRRRLGLK